jgi:16S rRNA (cytidine1402-2'-O)-methyltransferase
VAGALWIVGTPIGNLSDLSPRAREALESVDLVAAEDTRRSGRLLEQIGVSKPLVSFFEGNERERTKELIDRLRDGESVALVTDGGMPSVSDPGFRLVAASIDADIDVRVVPGPSAAIAALVASGLPPSRFSFEGFLPRGAGERSKRLAALRDDPRTLVFFESPRRVARMLQESLEALGDRRAAVARELTKLHEQIVRGQLSELAERFADSPPKGEVVVVIEGAGDPAPDLGAAVAEASRLVEGGAKKREAAKVAGEHHGVTPNSVYRAITSEPRADPSAG